MKTMAARSRAENERENEKAAIFSSIFLRYAWTCLCLLFTLYFSLYVFFALHFSAFLKCQNHFFTFDSFAPHQTQPGIRFSAIAVATLLFSLLLLLMMLVPQRCTAVVVMLMLALFSESSCSPWHFNVKKNGEQTSGLATQSSIHPLDPNAETATYFFKFYLVINKYVFVFMFIPQYFGCFSVYMWMCVCVRPCVCAPVLVLHSIPCIFMMYMYFFSPYDTLYCRYSQAHIF